MHGDIFSSLSFFFSFFLSLSLIFFCVCGEDLQTWMKFSPWYMILVLELALIRTKNLSNSWSDTHQQQWQHPVLRWSCFSGFEEIQTQTVLSLKVSSLAKRLILLEFKPNLIWGWTVGMSYLQGRKKVKELLWINCRALTCNICSWKTTVIINIWSIIIRLRTSSVYFFFFRARNRVMLDPFQ